ncbi:hypothetical protein N5B96_05505 [Acinetobacter johnsonii]|uniref:hypothetical protein n=1 Tax=Acinetobacter johnsonii TaxID=40214 RepID=UPI0024481601|nr:hypothetical protein [Acinetobacter johnsonii]MDH1068949.1 hypothetical protein [Acinetobacter johnsonii]
MAIEKLSEFAKDGQKNTDDLNLTDGFPVSKKPARQWFNWLFNSLTLKINEIIDDKFSKSGGTISGNLDIEGTITVLNIGDQIGAFKKLIQANTTTDGGYLAVGNTGQDRGFVEIGTTDDNDAEIYATQRDASSNIFRRATLLDGVGNTLFPEHVYAKTFNGGLNGNSSTASKLQTARTIGGVSFDGSANINLPGVNTAGNQNTTGNAATATTAAACSGNAATATKLQTARTINGVSFDGSANITIADNTKLPLSGGTITGSLNVSDTITVTNVGEQAGAFKKLIQADTTTDGGYIAVGNNAADKGYVEIGTIDDADAEIYASQRTSANAVLRRAKLLDGSGNTSFPGTVTAPTFSGALSGNAATATSLQTARTIGGVGFDGSANINLPGVNTTGNQNTSGNAASATDCSRSVIAGNGLSGGGALTSDRTVTLGTPGNITATSTNSVTETSHTHNLDVNSLPFLGTGINQRKSIISGTTYTNTGNRPIFVTCSMSGSSSNAASARLDGRMIFSTNSSNQYSQSFVVGVGVSYSFTGNNLVCEEYS